MANWPSSLCPLMGTFTDSVPDNVIRSGMDVGPDKVRRRTTANVGRVSFQVFIPKTTPTILDDFYITDTFDGVDPFTFIHPRTQAAVQARFTSPPSYRDRSNAGFIADVSLEILP